MSRTAAIFLLLFLLPSFVAANSLRGRTISVAVVPGTENTSDSIDAVIENAASVYIQWLGMYGTVVDSPVSSVDLTRRDVSDMAGSNDLVLFGLWTVADTPGSSIDVDLAVYEASSRTPLARRSGTVRLDESPERDVVELLQELFDDAIGALMASGSSLLTWSGVDGTAVGSAPQPEPGSSGTPVYAGPGLPDTVEFAAGYAPGLAVADTSRFYEAGHGGSVYGGLVLGRRSGIVAALSASAFFTHASGLSADGDLMVVPVAVSVRLRSLPSPVGAYATVGAGAALIQLKNPILGTFTKFAPHATGGLGVKVALTNWVGLNAGVTVDATFEGSTILTQIVPNISVYMGF